MSYTTVDQVRHHLVTSVAKHERIRNQQLVIYTDREVPFYGGPVDESSLLVKSVRSATLQRVSKELASGANPVGQSNLVRGSVVVASDSSLGQVFEESHDYVVDYDGGSINVKDSGCLEVGMTVCIWFSPYVVYKSGTDYQVDCNRGEMRALVSGGIANRETVELDYSPVYTDLSDEIVNQAVLMANSMIEQEIDPEQQFGANPILTAGATFRALEIVSRVAAGRDLAMHPRGDRTAPGWMKLADDYRARADQLLKCFRPPVSGPSLPRRT
jgi:hypothetical protein